MNDAERALLLPWRHTSNQVAELSVAPDAVNSIVVFGLLGRLVDGAAAPPVFEGEIGGVGHVKGDHVIIHVAAQVDDNRNTKRRPVGCPFIKD